VPGLGGDAIERVAGERGSGGVSGAQGVGGDAGAVEPRGFGSGAQHPGDDVSREGVEADWRPSASSRSLIITDVTARSCPGLGELDRAYPATDSSWVNRAPGVSPRAG
jgi:hypothetical protein